MRDILPATYSSDFPADKIRPERDDTQTHKLISVCNQLPKTTKTKVCIYRESVYITGISFSQKLKRSSKKYWSEARSCLYEKIIKKRNVNIYN